MDIRKRHAAEEGYGIYLNGGPSTSIGQINAALRARGMPEIRDRTFKHFRRLAQRGQRSYIPINEFDIAIKHNALGAAR